MAADGSQLVAVPSAMGPDVEKALFMIGLGEGQRDHLVLTRRGVACAVRRLLDMGMTCRPEAGRPQPKLMRGLRKASVRVASHGARVLAQLLAANQRSSSCTHKNMQEATEAYKLL